jgi:uncharacterized protein YjbI with pentapeptide repeats
MAENFGAQKIWTRVSGFIGKGRARWWTAGVILLTALVIVIRWKVQKWQVEHIIWFTSKESFDRIDEAGKTIAAILSGLVALVGGFVAWRNYRLTKKSLGVSQEGQIADRFTKAIEQLGAVDATGTKNLAVRLGGIYELGRIADQSERDHWPIVEQLCTYVRQNAPLKPRKGTRENQETLDPDIQAILTFLCGQDRKSEKENQHLNLRQTDIHGADLHGAHLSGADLRAADLSGADLRAADLTEANLTEADLTKADLFGAKLHGAYLNRADLMWANLNGADLSGARLLDANLSGADFIGQVTLRSILDAKDGFRRRQIQMIEWPAATEITQVQLEAAKGDSNTKLPNNRRMPESWKKKRDDSDRHIRNFYRYRP